MKIGKHQIGEDSRVFIIAELSANHNGSIETAIETIRAAKRAGADAIKLQTYTADTMTIDCDKDDFIITISSSGNSQNITNVLSYCKNNSINTLALSGLNKQNMSILNSKYSIYVPMKTFGVVECIHQIILHLLLDESMGIMEWDKKESQNMNNSNVKL